MTVQLPQTQLLTTFCPNVNQITPSRDLSNQEKDAWEGMILCMTTPVCFSPKVSLRVHKLCIECGTGTTPLWRNDANGNKTLCNACGIKWARNAKKNKTHTVAIKVIHKTKKARFNKEKEIDDAFQTPLLQLIAASIMVDPK